MYPLFQKLLSILLMLLLWLSPLQLVSADTSTPFEQNKAPCHNSLNSINPAVVIEQTRPACDMCEQAGNNCNESCSSLVQCGASNTLALLQGLPSITKSVSVISFNLIDVQLLIRQGQTLFRPPRA